MPYLMLYLYLQHIWSHVKPLPALYYFSILACSMLYPIFKSYLRQALTISHLQHAFNFFFLNFHLRHALSHHLPAESSVMSPPPPDDPISPGTQLNSTEPLWALSHPISLPSSSQSNPSFQFTFTGGMPHANFYPHLQHASEPQWTEGETCDSTQSAKAPLVWSSYVAEPPP